MGARLRPGRLPLARGERRAPTTSSRSRALGDGRRAAARLRPQPLAGAARRLPRRDAARAAAGARCSTPTRRFYGGTGVGNLGGVEAEAVPWHEPAVLGAADPAAARRRLARPGVSTGALDVGSAAAGGRRRRSKCPRRGRLPRGAVSVRRGRRASTPRARTASSLASARSAGDDYRLVARRRRPLARSVLALAAAGRARAVARPRHRRLRVERRRLGRPAARRARDLRAPRRHVQRGGTFAGVVPRLAGLRELGVTAIELMPVATFPGERGWGYDGLYTYAAAPGLRRAARARAPRRRRARRRASA